MPNRILFAGDIAEMLTCTEKQVEDMWRAKKLPGMKAGRSWFVTEAALFDALDELCGLNFVRAAAPDVVVVQAAAVQVPEAQRKAANSRRYNAEPPTLPPLPNSKQAVG